MGRGADGFQRVSGDTDVVWRGAGCRVRRPTGGRPVDDQRGSVRLVLESAPGAVRVRCRAVQGEHGGGRGGLGEGAGAAKTRAAARAPVVAMLSEGMRFLHPEAAGHRACHRIGPLPDRSKIRPDGPQHRIRPSGPRFVTLAPQEPQLRGHGPSLWGKPCGSTPTGRPFRQRHRRTAPGCHCQGHLHTGRTHVTRTAQCTVCRVAEPGKPPVWRGARDSVTGFSSSSGRGS
jgi:hypothetical protein